MESSQDSCFIGTKRLCNVTPSVILSFCISLIGIIIAFVGILGYPQYSVAAWALLSGIIGFWIPSPAFNNSKVTHIIQQPLQTAV